MQPRLKSLRWASKPESSWAANTRVAPPVNDPTSELEQQRKGFKSKMGNFDKFFEILPISGFRCKIIILRLIFLVESKRIKVN